MGLFLVQSKKSCEEICIRFSVNDYASITDSKNANIHVNVEQRYLGTTNRGIIEVLLQKTMGPRPCPHPVVIIRTHQLPSPGPRPKVINWRGGDTMYLNYSPRRPHDFLPTANSLSVSLTDNPPNNHSFECLPRHGSLTVLPVASRPGLAISAFVRGIGDFGRLWETGSLDRLRERPRRRCVMAPKNWLSVGEALVRDAGDVGEVVDSGKSGPEELEV